MTSSMICLQSGHCGSLPLLNLPLHSTHRQQCLHGSKTHDLVFTAHTTHSLNSRSDSSSFWRASSAVAGSTGVGGGVNWRRGVDGGDGVVVGEGWGWVGRYHFHTVIIPGVSGIWEYLHIDLRNQSQVLQQNNSWTGELFKTTGNSSNKIFGDNNYWHYNTDKHFMLMWLKRNMRIWYYLTCSATSTAV